MGLQLRTTAMSQGQAWVRQGFITFLRRPGGFVSLLMAYVVMVFALAIVPLAGLVLVVATWPLLTLAFMLATPDVLRGDRVRPMHVLAIWREPRPQRIAMLLLCGSFAGLIVLIVVFAVWLGGDELVEAVRSLSKTQLSVEAMVAFQHNPAVERTQGWISGLASLLAIPFWHAPALVHWGGQSAGQALFSSTLALWRGRSAFVLFSLLWLGCTFVGSVLAALLGGLLAAIGLGPLALIPGLAMTLMLSAAFYTSLWFMFADTFGVDIETTA